MSIIITISPKPLTLFNYPSISNVLSSPTLQLRKDVPYPMSTLPSVSYLVKCHWVHQLLRFYESFQITIIHNTSFLFAKEDISFEFLHLRTIILTISTIPQTKRINTINRIGNIPYPKLINPSTSST